MTGDVLSAVGAQIAAAIAESIPSSARLLVAVSGGIDSTVLLEGLLLQRVPQGLTLEVAHIDHRLRESSGDDADFVRALAARHSLEFHHKALLVPENGVNIEAWGRGERYRFLTETIHARALDFIVTAHHANDQAETVLMRFLANREPTSIHRIDHERKIIRPFLSLFRSQLEAFAVERGITYRDDPSNKQLDILRNRYRHRILPFLEQELGTDPIRVLSERAESLEDDASALESLARHALKMINEETLGSKEWFRELRTNLREQPRAVQWRMVERVLALKYGTYVGRRTSLRVLRFIESEEIAIEISGGRRIRRARGGLEF